MIPTQPGCRSQIRWPATAERYTVAVGATLFAFAATDALKHLLPAPTFLFFIPALALAAWYGGPGPSVTATTLSLVLIRYAFMPSRAAFPIPRVLGLLDVVAFLVIALTITLTTEALRRARRLAESHALELERANEEVTQVASRGTKLLEAITALSQARTVGDVATVVLGKGLALVEASSGILVYTDGAGASVLGLEGMGPEFQARVNDRGRDADLAVTEAIRTNREIWIGSPDEYRQRYPWASAQARPHSEIWALCAIPLVHAGETIGGLALGFSQPTAFGVTDRTFTLLLAQATAAALDRAWSYDSEQQKRRDAELLARAREEVLAVVAHDLRNPLNLIKTTAQLLIEETLPPARQRAMLDIATRAATQMNRLISDLLDTVRLQAGRLSLDVEDVVVEDILHQTEETFHPIAEEKQVQLDILAPDAPEAVRADPLRLSQIVGNLVGNALKFTPPHGRVTLHAAPRGDDVVFLVGDTGPGIPPEDVEHLFDKFWQGRPSDRRGAGLGLAIARGLVEAQGGRIWVESALGKGSTFAFTVPAAPTRVPAPRRADVATPVPAIAPMPTA
jgi:signal transduction histidine kinase